MKTKTTEPRPESEEPKTMTRGKAIKKAAKVTLTAGTMLVLLNNPQKAFAGSGAEPGGSTLVDFGSGSTW